MVLAAAGGGEDHRRIPGGTHVQVPRQGALPGPARLAQRQQQILRRRTAITVHDTSNSREMT